jgi:hypothetical protein
MATLGGAVRHQNQMDEGGVTMPDGIDEKTGDPVAEV